MILKKILLRNAEGFDSIVFSWATQNRIDVEIFDGKLNLFDIVDGLVILHTDHNILREHHDLREAFIKKGKESHQVDINGTLGAAADSLKFWLENNRPKAILIVGSDQLAASPRLRNYFDQFAKRIISQ